MLNVGDKIFIPNYGAGIVVDINNRNFFEKEEQYIKIYLIVDDMNLLIPAEKFAKYNFRNIVSKETMEETLKIIACTPEKVETNWSKRYRKNKIKIARGNVYEMCQVVRDLYYLKSMEMLPVGEEKILEKAQHMLISEIMLIFNIDKMDARFKIMEKSE